jgi:hypothetical protein
MHKRVKKWKGHAVFRNERVYTSPRFASAMVEGGLINISKCIPSANKSADEDKANKLDTQKPEALPNSQQPKGKASIFNTILNKIK